MLVEENNQLWCCFLDMDCEGFASPKEGSVRVWQKSRLSQGLVSIQVRNEMKLVSRKESGVVRSTVKRCVRSLVL